MRPLRTSDIHLDVMRVPFEKLSSLDGGEPSSTVRARVEAARAVQAERIAPLGKPHVLVNGDVGPAEVFSSSGESIYVERLKAPCKKPLDTLDFMEYNR